MVSNLSSSCIEPVLSDPHLVVAEDAHEVGRHRRLGRQGDEVHALVEFEAEIGHLDVLETGAEVRVEEVPRRVCGILVESDAPGREPGGVERLAHPRAQQVAERGVDREPDGSGHRHQRDGEKHRRDAAAIAEDLAAKSGQSRQSRQDHAIRSQMASRDRPVRARECRPAMSINR
jgi:hypothetical protein